MDTYGDGDTVELMTTFNRGQGLEPVPCETHAEVFGPERGLGNYRGTGQLLVSFEGIGVYNLPETWFKLVKKKGDT